jgi:hypothetical protein
MTSTSARETPYFSASAACKATAHTLAFVTALVSSSI